MSEIILLSNRDHSFSKYAKFSKKLIFLSPCYANARKWMILKWMIPYWLNGIHQLLAMIFSNIKSKEATMGSAGNNLENSQKQKCWKNSWKCQGKILEEYHNLLNVAYFLQRSHCVKSIRENADQNNSEYGHFLRRTCFIKMLKNDIKQKSGLSPSRTELFIGYLF